MLQIEEECNLESLKDLQQAVCKIDSDVVTMNQILQDFANSEEEYNVELLQQAVREVESDVGDVNQKLKDLAHTQDECNLEWIKDLEGVISRIEYDLDFVKDLVNLVNRVEAAIESIAVSASKKRKD
jgi:hypothetical protein